MGVPSPDGEMTEWPKVHDWKSCVPKGTVGSNPTLSASGRIAPCDWGLGRQALVLTLGSHGAGVVHAASRLHADVEAMRKVALEVGAQHLLGRGFDIVLDALELEAPFLGVEHGVAGAVVVIAWLTD